jgi:hypothetical protein
LRNQGHAVQKGYATALWHHNPDRWRECRGGGSLRLVRTRGGGGQGKRRVSVPLCGFMACGWALTLPEVIRLPVGLFILLEALGERGGSVAH